MESKILMLPIDSYIYELNISWVKESHYILHLSRKMETKSNVSFRLGRGWVKYWQKSRRQSCQKTSLGLRRWSPGTRSTRPRLTRDPTPSTSFLMLATPSSIRDTSWPRRSQKRLQCWGRGGRSSLRRGRRGPTLTNVSLTWGWGGFEVFYLPIPSLLK